MSVIIKRSRHKTSNRRSSLRTAASLSSSADPLDFGASQHVLERFRIARLWAGGIVLIAGGFFIEENLELFWRWIAFLQGTQAVPTEHVHLLPIGVLLTVLIKELGVAIVVAAIIVGGIERRSRQTEHASAKKLREEVANDAVFAIFSVQHTREFVRAAVETNLGAQIVRENAHLDYSLRSLTKSEAKAISPKSMDDALARFVICQMVSNYTLRNVSASRQLVTIRFELDVREGEGARALTGARYVCIDGEVLSNDDIRAGEVPTEQDHNMRYEWQRWVETGEDIRVLIAVASVKEHSDNDVWESFFPTMGEMTFSLNVLPSMVFGVRPLSNSEISPEPMVPSDTARTWRMQGPLLRHDSLVFWWRTPEDEGRADKSIPSAFSAPDAQERFVRDLVSAQPNPKHDIP